MCAILAVFAIAATAFAQQIGIPAPCDGEEDLNKIEADQTAPGMVSCFCFIDTGCFEPGVLGCAWSVSQVLNKAGVAVTPVSCLAVLQPCGADEQIRAPLTVSKLPLGIYTYKALLYGGDTCLGFPVDGWQVNVAVTF
jgi:hypothetical protein